MYITKQGTRIDYNLKEIFLDTLDELSNISVESTSPGSVAYIIDNGDTYILNSLKQWIKQTNGGGTSAKLQKDKEVTYTANGSYEITPDETYDGLKNALVTIDVPSETLDLTTGIKFSKSDFEIFPDILINANWNEITDAKYMFSQSQNLLTVPPLNTVNVIDFEGMFVTCNSLTEVSEMNTSKGESFFQMFASNTNLTTISLLDFSSAINVNVIVAGCINLQNLGGFKDLGKAYSTEVAENYPYYTLNLSIQTTNLTHDSLMNVINNLYDIKTKGCTNQSLVLGATNLAKLTAEEIAIATNKGWNVS